MLDANRPPTQPFFLSSFYIHRKKKSCINRILAKFIIMHKHRALEPYQSDWQSAHKRIMLGTLEEAAEMLINPGCV